MLYNPNIFVYLWSETKKITKGNLKYEQRTIIDDITPQRLSYFYLFSKKSKTKRNIV